MNKILIGSSAIKYWFPTFPREPKDLDYAVESKSNGSTREIEYLENPVLFSKKYEDYLFSNFSFADNPDYILDIDALYTLKISHMFWDINWKKHLFDIQWLKDKGCMVIEDLFYDLYKFWNQYHGKNKRSDLEMSAESFFNNAVKCEYDHDYLHTILVNPPTFTKILVGEVEVSEEKFNDLTFEEKCSLVREEVMIMAWERAPTWDYRKAYEVMLKKFILSHAPIWEALFILDNFKSLYGPKYNYFRKIEDGIKIRIN